MTSRTPAKKTAAKTTPKAAPKATEETTYRMPTEVHNWIEQANSLIKYQKTEIADLKAEVKELKAYKVWASKRLTQSERD
jgi:hypothetical protein